jgi:hypothetical protein
VFQIPGGAALRTEKDPAHIVAKTDHAMASAIEVCDRL